MGQEVRQDWAIPLPALHGLMDLLEDEWSQATGNPVREQVASLGAFTLIAFCSFFWGSKVFMMDLHGLRQGMADTKRLQWDHVVIPLLGHFKGEWNTCYHLAPLAAETKSRLKVQSWVERLIEVREKVGRVQSPAICDRAGEVARSFTYDVGFVGRLLIEQAAHPDLIPSNVDVSKPFGMSQSFRRGSTLVAQTRGVDDKQVELINWWRKVDSARGRSPLSRCESITRI